MSDQVDLAAEFEGHRAYLQAVAYRMLGSVSDAEDAVQDCWLRLQRVDRAQVRNLRSWLTRVIGRVCLDALGSARARRETYVGEWLPEPVLGDEMLPDPADRVALQDSVGLAVLVLLETLTPDERVAFVLHDVFGLPFADIADVVGGTSAAARQLASRARGRVQSGRPRVEADPAVQRAAVEAFLRAARDGDLAGLIEVLDPDVVWHTDAGGRLPAPRRPVVGADRVTRMVLGQAPTYTHRARVATVNGAPGIVVVEADTVQGVIAVTVAAGRITEVMAIYNPDKMPRPAAR